MISIAPAGRIGDGIHCDTSVTSPHVTFAPPSGASSAFFRVKRVR